MATVKTTLSISSSDLLSDTLSFSTTASVTRDSHSSGLARENITSTTKVMKISCLDGDAATAGATLQGQYLDITDNHGLKRRYVVVDGAATSVATGDVIASGTDIGSDTPANLGLPELVGGIAIDVPAGQTQHAVLTLLKAAIEHANGHNGSITVAAVSGTSDGPQNITLTNAVTTESGMFFVDAAGSNLSILDNTGDADATHSQQNHAKLIEKGKYTSPAQVYIKNTATYHATNNVIYLYYDNHAAEDIMEIRGGEHAFMPITGTNNLWAYASTSGTVAEFMIIGTEA